MELSNKMRLTQMKNFPVSFSSNKNIPIIPSGNFAIIAMKETSKLEHFEVRYPIAKKGLSEDSYVDNTFETGKSVEGVRKKIEEINVVASHGGFKYKE